MQYANYKQKPLELIGFEKNKGGVFGIWSVQNLFFPIFKSIENNFILMMKIRDLTIVTMYKAQAMC